MPENLYFIAVVPPRGIQTQVTSFKELIAHRFGSKHALKSPPHITIIPPFWWNDIALEELRTDLKDWFCEKAPFEVGLVNFNCFKPRVIYIDILPNESLRTLQSELKNHLIKRWKLLSNQRGTFHPHLTIAFKDLKPSSFYRAWELFKEQKYSDAFLCTHLHLLKYFDGKWQLLEKFALAG